MKDVKEKSPYRLPFRAVFTGGIVAAFTLLVTLVLTFWLVSSLWNPLAALVWWLPSFVTCFVGVSVVRCFVVVTTKQAAKLAVCYLVAPTIWVVCYGLEAIFTMIFLYLMTIPTGIFGGISAAAMFAPPKTTTIEEASHITSR